MTRLTVTRRTILALGAGALLALLSVHGCSHRQSLPPTAARSHSGVSPSPSPAGTQSAQQASLQAATVIRQLARLIAHRRVAEAQRLLQTGAVWPASEMRAIRRCDFRSARVWGDPNRDQVTLLTRLRLAVTRRSPLSTGLATLFITLRRDGTTGDWLVAAVTTSP